jgi:hypothetical protein
MQFQRIEYAGNTVVGEVPQHCAYCGSSNIVPAKIDAYWYDLAESFGYERSADGAELIRGLYNLWQPSEFHLFRDFIKSLNLA